MVSITYGLQCVLVGPKLCSEVGPPFQMRTLPVTVWGIAIRYGPYGLPHPAESPLQIRGAVEVEKQAGRIPEILEIRGGDPLKANSIQQVGHAVPAVVQAVRRNMVGVGSDGRTQSLKPVIHEGYHGTRRLFQPCQQPPAHLLDDERKVAAEDPATVGSSGVQPDLQPCQGAEARSMICQKSNLAFTAPVRGDLQAALARPSVTYEGFRIAREVVGDEDDVSEAGRRVGQQTLENRSAAQLEERFVAPYTPASTAGQHDDGAGCP